MSNKLHAGETQAQLEARYGITAEKAARNAGYRPLENGSGEWRSAGGMGRYKSAFDVCTHCLCW
jgi:hypothetical protein